jgi:signal peptidase I
MKKLFKKIIGLPKNVKQWQESALDFLADIVIIFLVVFLIIRPFIAAPFQVQQNSMEPNVHDSEYIIVSKLPYNQTIGWQTYQRGDVVVFRPPTQPENYLIKRVIGLPGETVQFFDGSVWVRAADATEFTRLADDFLAAENQGETCLDAFNHACTNRDKRQKAEITVPAGHYFVMGDNRLASRDGRTCFVGRCAKDEDRFLAFAEIEGRAWFTFFPLTGMRTLANNVFDAAPTAATED